MNKSIILLTMISAAYAGIASAQDQNFYAGLSIGRSSADVTEITRQDILNNGFSSLNTFQSGTSKSDTAWKIYGGYRFNPNVAAEFFYANLGKYSSNASGNGASGGSPSVDFSVNRELKITGFGVAGLLGAPLSDQWSIFAKPGLLFWDAKKTSFVAKTGTSQSGSESKSGTSPSLGVGTSYAFTDKLSARLEWERYFDVGDKNTTGKSDVDLFALSVQFTP
jgi:opacity protein-like surface antigen